MNHFFLQKHAPVRIGTRNYKDLREGVLRRDGWRCQLCGSRANLEIHHQQFRSHSGEDTEDNLITLCSNCIPPFIPVEMVEKDALKDALKMKWDNAMPANWRVRQRRTPMSAVKCDP